MDIETPKGAWFLYVWPRHDSEETLVCSLEGIMGDSAVHNPTASAEAFLAAKSILNKKCPDADIARVIFEMPLRELDPVPAPAT